MAERCRSRLVKDCKSHVRDKRALRHEVTLLKRQLDVRYTEGFIAGSSAGVGGIMAAVSERLGPDGELWLSDVMLCADQRKPPFTFQNEHTERIVEDQIADVLRRCNISPEKK